MKYKFKSKQREVPLSGGAGAPAEETLKTAAGTVGSDETESILREILNMQDCADSSDGAAAAGNAMGSEETAKKAIPEIPDESEDDSFVPEDFEKAFTAEQEIPPVMSDTLGEMIIVHEAEGDDDEEIDVKESTDSHVESLLYYDDPSAEALNGATRKMEPLPQDTIEADFPLSGDESEDGIDLEDAEEGEQDEFSARKAKEKKKKRTKLLLCIFLPILAVLLLLFGITQVMLAAGVYEPMGINIAGFDIFGISPKVYKELTVEVGTTSLDPTDFVNQRRNPDGKKAEWVTNVYDLDRLGEYRLRIRFDGKEYDVVLKVVDTVPPVVEVKCALIAVGEKLDRSHLIKSVEKDKEEDLNYEISQVDTSTPGIYPIIVRITDKAGNAVQHQTRVYVAQSVSKVQYELGSAFPAVSEIVNGLQGMSIDSSFDPASLKTPGDQELPLRCSQYPEDVIYLPFKAVDTTPPAVVVKSQLELLSSNLPDPAALLESVADATETTVKYKEQYSFTEDGRYTVTVVVTDAAGNITEVDVEVFVYVTDITEAPLIIASDFTVEVGTAISYRDYIRVLDSADGEIDIYDKSKITFDESAVDTSTLGSYTLTITARDNDGNTASKSITVTVAHKALTEEEVRIYVSGILAELVNDSMTKEEKLRVVFEYITKTAGMEFTGVFDSSNLYYIEAYYGFTLHKGGYYTYLSMSRVMLDCLGIEYRVVERNGTRLGNHAWLLADFGDGWYHFDTSEHSYVWVKDTFKLTDAEVAEFTKWYDTKARGWNYYGFDHALYPATPVLNADGSYTYTPYTVTYSAGSGGSIEGETFQQVNHGETASTVTAVPANGFTFRGWSDGVSAPERSDVILGNLNVFAEFSAGSLPGKTYILSYSAQPGGYVSGKTMQNVNEGYKGTTVTAAANPGYLFKGWSDGVTTPERSDTATDNLTVTAIFEKDASTTILLYYPGPGGTISGKTTQVLPVGEKGSTVKAIPDNGYVFIDWSDGVKTPERSDSKDVEVTANFAKSSYSVHYAAGVGGHIEGERDQTVAVGKDAAAVKAVPAMGYLFKGWSDGVKTAERTDRSVMDDISVTAIFEKDENAVSVQYIASAGGSIQGTISQSFPIGGTTLPVKAVPAAGYVFYRWSDGSTTPERSDLVTGSMRYTAYFKRIEKLTVVFEAGEGGTIEGDAEQTVNTGESIAAVTAIPSAGYAFDGWYLGDEKISGQTALDYTVFESCTLTARFTKESVSYVYEFSAEEGGELSGSLSQTLAKGEQGSTVTAAAKEGYHFEGWFVGDTLISSSESLDIVGGSYIPEGERQAAVTARFLPL